MKSNESSVTSLVSAFSRAYHSRYDTPKIFDDFLAAELISAEEMEMISRNMIQGIAFFNEEIADRFQDQPDEILRWITQVYLAPTPLARAAYCEQVLLNEWKLGVKQYVVLGAGLDTFCFRHPELSDTLEIFEADHPATQESKMKRLDKARLPILQNLHLVPMDFSHSFSYQPLEDKGFKNERTFFSLLGVTYYLTKEENASLISSLFSELPQGSSIVLDFADENLFVEKGKSNRVEHIVKMAAAGGETMKSCFAYGEIELMLEKAGLLIYEHLSPEKIQELYFCGREDDLSAFETIHYIHAVKK
ncbi:class I SAM-dependent methyltransferase [Bacillus infantis]|uniref:class I SAM-dependent methyltransferase n=1 Tax=Bacillus infantis TaxID=324767 RepID=UPI00344C46C8